MKINNTQNRNNQILKKIDVKPELKYESLSEEICKDFPDFPKKMLPSQDENRTKMMMGYVSPVTDQVYIGERRTELEKELKETIPERMKKMNRLETAGGVIGAAGGLGFLEASCAFMLKAGEVISGTQVLPSIFYKYQFPLYVGSMVVTMVGALMAGHAGSEKHASVLEYDDSRCELDHLRKGEKWSPTCSYVPDDDTEPPLMPPPSYYGNRS